MQITEIAKNITSAKSTHHPVLIAIEGFGGAGKSTIASQLAKLLGNTYVIEIDDFIVKEKLMEPSWDKGSFDRARLEQQVLIPITNDRPASYQKLIWSTNELSEPVTIPATDYLIIEGISSYHPDIATERGRTRDGSNEDAHWELWSQNDLRYQQRYHPEIVADFIINNA